MKQRWLGSSRPITRRLVLAFMTAFVPTVARAADGDGAAPAGTVSPVEGFRSAQFGMREPALRAAIRHDFPQGADHLARATHPSEKTTVLALTAQDLLPDSGAAQIAYILGYTSKQLVQVNVTWSSDGRNAARDEAIVATANALRDHFQAEHLAPPERIVVNQGLGQNAILVFRAAQANGRMVVLTLNGTPASARDRRASAPLTLQLAYIADYNNPDIFRIGPGRF